MKEKRVDVNLAKAGFYQVMFYGFGGAFLTELVDYPNINIMVLLGSALGITAVATFVHHFYAKATQLCKKKKHKDYDY